MFDDLPPSHAEVVAWAQVIHEVRTDTQVSSRFVSDAELFALIDLESNGQADARRDGSRYWGLTHSPLA